MHCSIFSRCLLAALLFGLWTAPAWAIGTTPPSWKPRETVTGTLADFWDMVGADRSLAYDHHGNPGIAFFDDVDGDLRYARRVPGVGWVHAAIDTVGDVGLVPVAGLRPLRAAGDQLLRHDEWRSQVRPPQRQRVADRNRRHRPATSGMYTSLAFDLLGRPAIAYYDITNTSLKYVQDTDGDFSLCRRDAGDRRQSVYRGLLRVAGVRPLESSDDRALGRHERRPAFLGPGAGHRLGDHDRGQHGKYRVLSLDCD